MLFPPPNFSEDFQVTRVTQNDTRHTWHTQHSATCWSSRSRSQSWSQTKTWRPAKKTPQRQKDLQIWCGCWKMLEDVGRCWKMLEDVGRCWKVQRGVACCAPVVYRTFWMVLQYLEVPGVMTKNLTRHFESKPLGSGNHNGAATCVLIEFKTQFSW